MSIPLVDSEAYYRICSYNYKKTDDTANGLTADKVPEEPTQTEFIGIESTDARKIANTVFTESLIQTPASILVSGDTYDVTQSRTRINKLYGMTRKDFYKQSSEVVETRQNRIDRKAKIVADTLRITERIQDGVF